MCSLATDTLTARNVRHSGLYCVFYYIYQKDPAEKNRLLCIQGLTTAFRMGSFSVVRRSNAS